MMEHSNSIRPRLGLAIYRACLPLALVIGVSAPSLAVDQLTIREAVTTALAHNPKLRAADRQVDAARARETQAGAMPNPNLMLAIDQVPIPNPGGGNYMAGISQPLLLGGQREARLEAAKLDIQIAEMDREVLRRELSADVKDTYAQVLYEMARERQAGLDARAATDLHKSIEERYKSGEVARVEVLQAEVERDRTQREVESARSRVLQVLGTLNVLFGREALVPFAVKDLPLPKGENVPSGNLLITQALESRVELRRAEATIQREMLARQLVQSSLWTGTEASVMGGSVAGQPGFSLSLTLPIPFYRQQGEIAESEANRQRAEAERDALRNEITQEVERAYRDASISVKQVNLYLQSYLPQAERLAKNAQERYLVGEGSRWDVFQARRAHQVTQTAFLQAVLAYRQALVRLERAVGKEFLND